MAPAWEAVATEEAVAVLLPGEEESWQREEEQTASTGSGEAGHSLCAPGNSLTLLDKLDICVLTGYLPH